MIYSLSSLWLGNTLCDFSSVTSANASFVAQDRSRSGMFMAIWKHHVLLCGVLHVGQSHPPGGRHSEVTLFLSAAERTAETGVGVLVHPLTSVSDQRRSHVCCINI